MRGTIVRIFIEKNFGFIQGRVKGENETFERFLHRGSVSHESPVAFVDFEEGDIVDFEPGENEKGPRAESVKLFAKAGEHQPGFVPPDEGETMPDGYLP